MYQELSHKLMLIAGCRHDFDARISMSLMQELILLYIWQSQKVQTLKMQIRLFLFLNKTTSRVWIFSLPILPRSCRELYPPYRARPMPMLED